MPARRFALSAACRMCGGPLYPVAYDLNDRYWRPVMEAYAGAAFACDACVSRLQAARKGGN